MSDAQELLQEIADLLDDDLTVEKRRSFERYLREEVFISGTYHYEEAGAAMGADMKVAEFGDGMGHIITSDMKNAIDDPNVEVLGVSWGWLRLGDNR